MNGILNMKRILLLGCTLGALAGGSAGHAQTYPSKPVRIIVAFAPGGTNDILARLMSAKFTEAFGQTFVVDNRPGAGGNIGTDLVAKAAPDGYTLLLASTGPHVINPHFYPKMPYDTLKDFTPISLVGKSTALLVLHPSIPASSVKQLVTLAKSGARPLNYASSGNGSSGHLAGELFKTMAGISMQHIPYKGNGPAFTDLVGGQVDLMFANKPGSLPFVQSGKLKAIAITSAKRDPQVPAIPTVAETVPGFEASTWWGVLAPAGLPPEITDKLHAAIVKIMASPEARERMATLGADPATSSSQEYLALIQKELVQYGQIVKRSGMKLE
jgi:tripartite-type tricarboxylate transporter receptor subunit TctC